MDFYEYLDNLPLLHNWDGGKTWCTGGFQREHLEKLHDFLKKNLPLSPRMLETGAGNSTIAMLFLAPRKLVSIAPAKKLFERINDFCTKHGISFDTLEIYADGSQWVLPKLAENIQDSELYDFVLLDGSHNWPLVFVDFFYANYMLKPGGYMMLDDIQLHSIKELARLLNEQPGFKIELDLGKSLVFRRETEDRELGEWNYQPYIKRKSAEYAVMGNKFVL